MAQGPNILVIGIGNEYRCDDGVGRALARALYPMSDRVRVIEESGEGAALMEAWRGADTVILIDAVHSGGPPGTIYRFDARAQQIPQNFFRYSTHAFSLAEAVELARTLGQLPPTLIIYGIEGGNFEAGTELSPEVTQASGEVLQSIRGEIGKELN
ncbi:MAG: hydrogenase maturation protease [Verrucomicrobiota bacterium]